MISNEMKQRSDQELRSLEAELTRQLWKARLEHELSQLEDTAKITKLRRDIARAQTLISQRRLGLTSGASASAASAKAAPKSADASAKKPATKKAPAKAAAKKAAK